MRFPLDSIDIFAFLHRILIANNHNKVAYVL